MTCVSYASYSYFSFFFFNDTATTEIYTLSLHDALPISRYQVTSWTNIPTMVIDLLGSPNFAQFDLTSLKYIGGRSEEHTSELQSRLHLVCRLLLEKKNNRTHSKICGRQIKKYSQQANE